MSVRCLPANRNTSTATAFSRCVVETNVSTRSPVCCSMTKTNWCRSSRTGFRQFHRRSRPRSFPQFVDEIDHRAPPSFCPKTPGSPLAIEPRWSIKSQPGAIAPLPHFASYFSVMDTSTAEGSQCCPRTTANPARRCRANCQARRARYRAGGKTRQRSPRASRRQISRRPEGRRRTRARASRSGLGAGMRRSGAVCSSRRWSLPAS
jgi:hypothetical protein